MLQTRQGPSLDASQVSAVCEACRLIMSEVLLGRHRFNSAEVMVYLGPPTAALLLCGAAVQERAAFTAAGLHTVERNPALFAACALASFFVNLTTFLAIRYVHLCDRSQ